MSDAFHFVLKQSGWGYDDIYEALKTGEKTSEWRDASDHWIKRLLMMGSRPDQVKNIRDFRSLAALDQKYPRDGHFQGQPYKYEPKHRRAIFVVGFTKYPRLLADVKALYYHPDSNQFEVQIENVEEVVSG